MGTRTRAGPATVASATLVAFITLAVLIAGRAELVGRPDHAIHAFLIEFGSGHPGWVSTWHAITHLATR